MNETVAHRSVPCGWLEGQPLGALLVRLGRILEDRGDSSLGELGLSGAKLSVLTQLVSSEAPLPLGELATRLSCVRSNITQLVDRMEADGLVRRVDDPNDRRAVRAVLTPLGRERQRDGSERVHALEASFRERLSEDEQERLRDLLSKLL